jgi:methylated-DNA-protein-cysteine methyltransferase-like protein
MNPDDFRTRVLIALADVEPGQVLSYGDLAAEAGFPGAARAVGAVLASPGNEEVPWWRVVYADGRLAPGHAAEQGRRLRAEGVSLRDGRVAQLPSRHAARPRGGRGGGRRVR